MTRPRASVATVQDNRHVVVKDLKPATWTSRYIDFTRDGRRNDGMDTPFAAGHMVDGLFFFVAAPTHNSTKVGRWRTQRTTNRSPGSRTLRSPMAQPIQ
jgi:hypothetical protein